MPAFAACRVLRSRLGNRKGFLSYLTKVALTSRRATNSWTPGHLSTTAGNARRRPGKLGRPPAAGKRGPPSTIALAASEAIAEPSWTTAEAIRRKESSNALLKQLEYDQKCGRLLPADEVAATWRAHITDARKRLLTVPSRCAARIAHLSRAEIETIDREIRDALQDLAGVQA
jgi:hypothetical protein